MAELSEVVVLVPGFLGFGRIGTFFYFSERVAAAVRASLKARLGLDIPVLPCCTQPIGSLATRQRALLDELGRLLERAPDVRRIHLVGHSTGGLDAELLRYTHGLDGRPFDPRDAEVRRRIASVVTIATPHHGTTLTESREVAFVADPRADWRALYGLSRLGINLLRLIPYNYAKTPVLAGVLTQLPETMHFVTEMICHRDLIRDLRIAKMRELRARLALELKIPLSTFVTVAGRDATRAMPPDPFFEDLFGLTARHTTAIESSARHAVARLRGAPDALMIGGPAIRAKIGFDSSDGVVTSALQLLDPDDPAELAGVVCADHADVIGHYDRRPGPLDSRPLAMGMFHSGSGFDDEQFFELYDRVAARIAQVVQSGARSGALAG